MPQAFLASLLILLGPSLALAQSAQDSAVDEVEALAARAKAHYRAQEYNDAITLYLRAYQLAPAAGLLFNVAHIYDRKLDEPQLAMQFYRRYVTAPDAEPDIVMKANGRIQELKAEEKRREVEALTAPSPRPPDPVPMRADTSTTPAGSAQKTWGWVAVGGGIAIAGAGAVFGVQAQSSADEFESSTDLTTKKTARDDGESQALLADVLYGVGAAALVTGVILLVTAPEDGEVAWRVGPTDDGQGAAVWWGGSL